MFFKNLSNVTSGFLKKDISITSYNKHGIWFYEIELHQWGEKRVALFDKANFKRFLGDVFQKNGPIVFKIEYGTYTDDLEIPSWAVFQIRRDFLELYKTWFLTDFTKQPMKPEDVDMSLDFSTSLDFCK
jgi:hypothetical protein